MGYRLSGIGGAVGCLHFSEWQLFTQESMTLRRRNRDGEHRVNSGQRRPRKTYQTMFNVQHNLALNQ